MIVDSAWNGGIVYFGGFHLNYPKGADVGESAIVARVTRPECGLTLSGGLEPPVGTDAASRLRSFAVT